MYQYWGFGLNILSEIEFPELLPAVFQHADVTISYGAIPGDFQSVPQQGEYLEYAINETDYFLDVHNVCKYFVKDGAQVILEPYYEVESRSIRIHLLATVMAVVLLQKGIIPFHASGIIYDNRLILFTGDSGAGKSTTLAYLYSQGYQVFTDDVCVLKQSTVNENVIEGIASYPMLKLWDDTVVKLDNNIFNDKSFRIKPGMEKFGYFFHEHFIKEPVPINKIFILKKSTLDLPVTAVRLSGIEAFQHLERQAYRNHLINTQYLRTLQFRLLSQLSKEVEIVEISRSVNGTVAQFAKELIQHF